MAPTAFKSGKVPKAPVSLNKKRTMCKVVRNARMPFIWPRSLGTRMTTTSEQCLPLSQGGVDARFSPLFLPLVAYLD